MPRLKQAVCSIEKKYAQNAKLWNSYLKNPTERRHEALWNLYQPLVRLVAHHFSDKMAGHFELSELMDAGNVGLLDALAEFAPDAGPTFEALAVPMIRESMLRSLTVQRSLEKERLKRMEMPEPAPFVANRETPEEQRLKHQIAMRNLLSRLRRTGEATR